MSEQRRGKTNLLLNVVQRIRRVDREADQDDVRVRVRQGPQSVVVLLAGGIPEGELDLLAVDLDIGNATCAQKVGIGMSDWGPTKA